MAQTQAVTLSMLARQVGEAIASAPMLQYVWVVGETMDVRVSGGHCYLELVEKDPATSKPLARMRATIWANIYRQLSARFLAETGQAFRSDLKVMLCVSATHHPVYGMSLQVHAVNSAYTLGDAMRRRAEMVGRLRAEGIIDLNRSLAWPAVAQRIAVISAKGAAGYGDFINQLHSNPYRLRFETRLFEAAMQGEKTGESIIAALDEVAAGGGWDCVVIIRGGGATSDLAAFDNYDLAARIARFPIPVVIGIGHERDTTLLDYVANMRVKTPTAAAEWLVQKGAEALGRLQGIAQAMLNAVAERLGGNHRQLAFIAGALPAAAIGAVQRSRGRLLGLGAGLGAIPDRRLRPQAARLDGLARAVAHAARVAIGRNGQKLKSLETLAEALSPAATLRRGYSITRVGGRAVTSVKEIAKGQEMRTTLADGEVASTAL